MSLFIVATAFLTPTIHSFSSETPENPASNILEPEKREDYWETSSTADSWIIFDLGSQLSFNFIGLIHMNYTTFKWQFSNDSGFPAPLDSGNLVASMDRFTGIYRAYNDPGDFGTINHRYVRLWIPAQSTVDNDTRFKTGGVLFSDSALTFPVPPRKGYRILGDQAQTITDLYGGGIEKVVHGGVYARINFNLSIIREFVEFEMLANIFLDSRNIRPIAIFIGDQIFEDQNTSQYIYYVMNDDKPVYSIDTRVADIDSLNFRELI